MFLKDIDVKDKELVNNGSRWKLVVCLPAPVASAILKIKHELKGKPYTIDLPRGRPELKRRFFLRNALRVGASLPLPRDLSYSVAPSAIGSPITPAPPLAPPPPPPSTLPSRVEIVSNPVPGRDMEPAVRITDEGVDPITNEFHYMVEFVGHKGVYPCHSVSKELRDEWHRRKQLGSSVPPPPPPPPLRKRRGRPKKKSVTFRQPIGVATAPDPTAQRLAAAPSTDLDSSVRRAADLGAEQEAGPSRSRQSRRGKQLAPLFSGLKEKRK